MLIQVRSASCWLLLLVFAHVAVIGQGWTAEEGTGGAAVEGTSDADAQGRSADREPEPPTLSVAPSEHVVYPESRPAWVDAENDLDSDTHRWIVRTIPCDSREECDDRLTVALSVEVDNYTSQLIGSTDVDGLFPIDDDETMKQLIARRYDGTLTQGNLPAFESALELRIGPEIQSQLRRSWQNQEVRRRLGALGVIVTGGWAFLVAVATITAGLCRHRAA